MMTVISLGAGKPSSGDPWDTSPWPWPTCRCSWEARLEQGFWDLWRHWEWVGWANWGFGVFSSQVQRWSWAKVKTEK